MHVNLLATDALSRGMCSKKSSAAVYACLCVAIFCESLATPSLLLVCVFCACWCCSFKRAARVRLWLYTGRTLHLFVLCPWEK
jgi:hypothetical protein